MICSNCGNNIGNGNICPICGSGMQQNEKNTSNKKIKILVLVVLLCLVILILGILFMKSTDKVEEPKELSWDESYEDFKLEYVTQSTIVLGVNLLDESKRDKLEYEVSCGEVEVNETEIKWNLKESIGICNITVSYENEKISKEVTVISTDVGNEKLFQYYEINLDSDEDLDYDSLTNKQEKEYGTNPVLSDSDMDGLYDDYEIFTSKTDPNKIDSDNDGLSDYDEIELGLDPLKADSKGDGVKDGQRTLTYNHTTENLTVSVTGKGNVASTVAEVNSNTKISSKTGLIDKLYTLYTEGDMNEAVVTITYTEEELLEYGLTEDNLSIYYYNEKESKYEKIETVVDKENNILTATLKHFSNYVVGDSTLVQQTTTTEVLFILDNSWSMYTVEQYKEITGSEYPGELDGYDAEGLRFTLTSELIENLSSENYKIGLSEFRSDYKNILEIGSDKEKLKEKLNTMNGNFATQIAGTDINYALKRSIKEFSGKSDNQYIVILTDGQDSWLKYYEEGIIEQAIKKNVKICSVGFGEGSYNTQLANISNATGCKFYSSSDASGLSELFENIESELSDDLVDIDGDNEVDGILVADSGFVVNRDGFSFKNYQSNLAEGHCYGMATFAELYYMKKIPLSYDSITVGNEEDGLTTSYAYDLTNTSLKNYSNLYDYKPQTNIFKYSFGFNLLGEESPSDLKILEGTNLAYTAEYENEILNSGVYEIRQNEDHLSNEQKLEIYGFTYETYDAPYIIEEAIQTSEIVNNDDLQLLNAIYAAFIKQIDDVHYASGTTWLFWAADVFGIEAVDYEGEQGFINILKNRLNAGDPIVISTMGHAVNAISLVQDIENPNYYYIAVYDNNYPGEKRYYDLECKNNICKTVDNEYYQNGGEVLRITPSLEYDLEYYN